MPAASSTDVQRLAAVLSSVAEAVIITDAAGAISLANPAAERLLNINAGQAAAQAMRLGAVNQALGEWLERAIAEQRAQPLIFEMLLGDDRHFSVSLTPLYDAGKEARPDRAHLESAPAVVNARGSELTGWVVVLQDVTHLKRLEQWRSEAIQTAAHDLRNPLNTLNGTLNLLRDLLPNPSPEQQECLNMIKVSADRMSALVEQLLNLEHVEAETEMAVSRLTLSQVLEEVVAEFKLTAEAKRVQLEFAGEPATAQVQGDATWLHRAAANLVSNAIKYTPEGGKVVVRYREADGMGIVEVSDNGPGIPRQAQARLFERFYRVRGEATRRAPGAGLGLAIVKKIVERHGGQVWVSSEEGKGSTFGFSTPLVK